MVYFSHVAYDRCLVAGRRSIISRRRVAMATVVKVALIGAGRSGTPLLKQLMKYKYIKIVGVADRKEKAIGIKMAAKKKIFTTTDPMRLMEKSKNADILIDVTGDTKLKKKVKDYLAKSRNTKTIIMHDLIARLFISVSTKKTKLIPSFHPKDVGIGK
jgi:predicted homoserine dehydrogenase-like protein